MLYLTEAQRKEIAGLVREKNREALLPFLLDHRAVRRTLLMLEDGRIGALDVNRHHHGCTEGVNNSDVTAYLKTKQWKSASDFLPRSHYQKHIEGQIR